jgi:glycosyltransferase involved in cell wall biosynthesis
LYNLIFIDVSQFVAEPIRTGIQRVLVKIIENLPRRRLIPFRVLDPGHVAILDPTIFELFSRFFSKSTPSQRDLAAREAGLETSFSDEEHLIHLIGHAPLAVLMASRFWSRAARIINLESFSNRDRSRFYINCPANHRHKVAHFIYDFLLFEQPQVFPQLNWRYASDHLLLIEAYCSAGGFYVADETLQAKVAHYFRRPKSDILIVHFGGDISHVVNFPEPKPSTKRRRVLVVGTIEPRKFPLEVASALDELAVRYPDLDCVIAGKMGWASPETRAAIEAIFAGRRVRHLEHLADIELSMLIEGTDVAVYVSKFEGFGLPVIEYAARGIPLVTNRAIPAANAINDCRAEVIETVTVSTIVEAVERQLAASYERMPYYHWTWSNCAAEIAAWRAPDGWGDEPVFDPMTSWQAAICLVRELRGDPPEWEELKRRVRGRLFAKSGTAGLLCNEVTATDLDKEEQVEQISEIVSDNISLIYWADKVTTQPMLCEVVRCIFAQTPLEGVGRAFKTFLGRPIDPRAASEAVGMREHSQRLRRVTDLIHSDEATMFLPEATRVALRELVDGAFGFLERICQNTLDLPGLFEQFGIAAPSMDDIVGNEQRREEVIPPIRTALFFSHRRKLRGDGIDQWLEAIARTLVEQKFSSRHDQGKTLQTIRENADFVLSKGSSQIVEQMEEADSSTFSASNAAQTNGNIATITVSRQLPMESTLLTQGWYDTETDNGTFRWMGKQAVIINPEPLRRLAYVRVFIKMVYGADEPLLTASIDGIKADISVQCLADNHGWQIDIFVEQSGQRQETVTIDAIITDSPARAENSYDDRELSFAISKIAFVYHST